MKKITFLLLILSLSAFSQSKQLDSYIDYEYDESSETWIESYKAEFTYNSDHKNTDELNYYYESGSWILEYELHYIYDENGNVIEINSQEEDEDPRRKILTYDANNNLIQKVRLIWDTTTNQFINSFKEVFNFDENNLETDAFYYNWNNSQWEYSYKETNQYNALNLLEETKGFQYDTSTNQWDSAHQKITYNYNGNNKLIEELEYYFDNIWVNQNKTTYQYNIDNKVTEQIGYNYTDDIWITNNKSEYFYDEQSNLTEQIFSSWNIDDNIWIEEEKINPTQYNNNYDFSTLALPYDFYEEDTLIFFNHMVTEMIIQEKEDSTWTNSEKIDLYYSDVTASTSDISNEVLSIYPNPFINELSINFPTQENVDLSLFDIRGRKVFHKTILSTEKVNVNTLDNGIYFYEAITNNHKFKGKLIKK